MLEKVDVELQSPDQQPNQDGQEPPSKRLWTKLNGDGLYTKSYEDFAKQFSTREKVSKLHQSLYDQKLYSKGESDFVGQFFPEVKKKVGSIDFDLSSTNIPSDLEAQSTLTGGKQEVPTIELFETSDGDKIPTSDVVSLLNKSAQLREPTVPVVSGSTGGAGVSMKPDPEKEKEADKIKELVRSKGFDPDKIYEDYRDVSPDQARVPGFRPQDKAENPQLYERKIAAAAWQPNLKKAIDEAINEGNIPDEKVSELNNLIKESTTPGFAYGYRRQLTAKLADAIRTYVKDEDKKERLLKKLAIDRSVSYGIEDPAKISEVTQTTESKYLDPDQALAYQFLSDTQPEVAKGYNILFVDPEKVKSDESNAAVGYQYKASRLKQIGLQLRQNAIQEQLNDLGSISAKRELTPEETAKAQNLMSEAEKVAGEYKAMDVKYPAVKKYNDVQMLQDIMGNASIEDEGRLLGGPMWLATKLSRGFEETGGSLVDILGEPFRNPEASKLHQLDVLGEKMMFDTLLQVPQSDKALQDYEIHIEPEIKKQIESIKANPNLSFKEKNKQVYDLMQAHPNAFQRAPIKGAKLNINLASAFYSLGDLAASVAPYVVLETATGGGATAGLARKFISSFNAAALTSFRSAYADAIDKGEANPMAYAMRNVAINAAAMAGAQTPAMVKKLLGTESAVGSIVSKMDDKAIQAVLEKPDSRLIRLGKAFGSKVGEGLKGGAKFEAAMLPAKLINKKLNKEEIDPEELVKESAVMIMSMGALGMGGVPVKYKELTELDKGSILKAAEDPEAHKASALKMYQEGNISREQYEQSVKNIDLAQKAAETTKFMDNDGNPLPERKKAELLAAKIQEAKLKEQSTGDVPSKLKEKATAELEELNNDIEKIYEPEEEVTRNGVTIQPPMEIPEPITVGGETAPKEVTRNGVTIQPPMEIPEPITVGGETAPKEVAEPVQPEVSQSVEGVEQRIPGNPEQVSDVASEAAATVPVTKPFEEGKRTILSHRGLQEVATQFGLKDVTSREVKKDAQLFSEAKSTIDKWVNDGKYEENVSELVRKGESGDPLSDEQSVILAQHIANLREDLDNTPVNDPLYDEKLRNLQRVNDAGTATRSAAGASLRVPQFTMNPNGLPAMMLREMDVNGKAPLTEAQKQQVLKEHTEISEAQKKFDEKVSAIEAQNVKNETAAEIKKYTRTSKAKEQYQKERDALKQKLKQQFDAYKSNAQKMGIAADGGAESFKLSVDMAKTVLEIVKSHVDEVGANLGEVVKRTLEEISDFVPGLSERDIHDVIAGKYSEVKPKRSELAANLYDLKSEVNLIQELERVQAKEPKTEKEKIQKNQKLESYRRRIKEDDFSKLEDRKKRLKDQIAKITEQLKSGDFEKSRPKEKPELDKEAIALQDELIKLKNERQLRLLRQEYENRNKWEKAVDFGANVLNVPRALMSTLDMSGLLRQGLVVVAGHPKMGMDAAKKMMQAATSKKFYDRWFDDLKNSPRYELMNESGLALSDIDNPKLALKEEQFMSNLAERIPGAGELVKASDRSYSMVLNKLRADLFNRLADAMEERGLTYKNSPEQYKQLAQYVNNATGRGDLGKWLNNAAPLLNSLFFSPRLISSRLNMLTYFMQPRFYSKVPKEVRNDYFKSMARLIGLGMTVIGLASLNDDNKVESDPRSSDFGKIVNGNTRWDVWGGFQQYIRAVAQILSGAKKSASTGEIRQLEAGKPYSQSRGDVAMAVLRGKLAPVPSWGLDLMMGETGTGQRLVNKWEGDAANREMGIKEQLANHLLPLTYTGMAEALKDQGTKAWFTVGLPSLFGVGTQTYESNQPSNKKAKKEAKDKKEKKE